MHNNRMLCYAAFMFCLIVLSGCATVTNSVHVKRQENDQTFKAAVAGKKIFILQPFISAKTTNHEAPVAHDSCGATSLSNLIEESIRNIGQETGASPLIARNDAAFIETYLQDDSAKEAITTLEDNHNVLLSYYRDKTELVPSLRSIAEATGAELICAYSINVKVGGSGGWDPNSGRIWQGTSSTSVKAVLISTSTGKILWGNEMFARTIASDTQAIKAAEKLFTEEQ